jgi:hypothetical protein
MKESSWLTYTEIEGTSRLNWSIDMSNPFQFVKQFMELCRVIDPDISEIKINMNGLVKREFSKNWE